KDDQMKNGKSKIGKVRLLAILLLTSSLLLGFGLTIGMTADDPTSSPPPFKDNLSLDAGQRGDKEIHPTLSSTINELISIWKTNPDQLQSYAFSQGLTFQDDLVSVMLILETEEISAAVKQYVQKFGGEVTSAYKNWVDATIPIGALEEVSNFNGISFVRAPIPVVPIDSIQAPINRGIFAGTYTSQGVAASNANAWHTAGFTGQGVNVAVLDSFKDYATAQANGNLPSSISTHGSLDTNSSRHGTAVAEIIYDMAPGISLTFASPSSATQMATYIVELAQAGNQIISSSMGFYNGQPGDGTGPVSDAINTAQSTYGTLYVQAAGNQANYHWDGAFDNSVYGDEFHEYGVGDEFNSLGSLSSGTIYLFLRWNDWPTSDQDYDLFLYTKVGSVYTEVAASENVQSGTQPPTESIIYSIPSTAEYGIVIYNFSADGSHTLDLMGHNAPSFERNISNRSLVDPATPSGSFSVAAVHVSSPYNLESYSSWGPTHGSGGVIGGGMDKPRIAGFANVDTWAYGSGGFNGTSSAAPHVSGASALVLSGYPGFMPTDIINFLEGRAVDQGVSGYDYLYGAGRLHLGDPPEQIFAPLISKE
ncbi:MAG: S8 family serine peptidase, partial [Candidatus Omnitrophica bacterium]|nr:S8 family serine peptidase [Candidatus Omnitrophota bacterium]